MARIPNSLVTGPGDRRGPRAVEGRSLAEPGREPDEQRHLASRQGNRVAKSMSSGEFWAYLVCARDESADVQLGYLVRDKASWSRLTRFRLDFRDALLTAAYLSAFRGPAGILRIGTWNRYGRL